MPDAGEHVEERSVYPPPMRILHLSTRLILGGSQENTVLSCEGQAALGHEVHLAFGPIYGPEGSLLDRVRAFRAPNGRAIQVHVLPNLVREIAPMKDSYCARELRGFLTVLRPDIVHTHSSKAGILGREAAWRVNAHQRAFDRKYPGGEFRQMGVVHTIHGPPFMPIEGGLGKRLKVRLLNMAYTLAEKRAAHHCHVLVSVADAMTLEFLRRGIGRAEQYITVRSGMETRAFLDAGPGEEREDARRRLGIGDDAFVVGTVARLAEHKGHDDLLDALADDLRQPDGPVLLWVGDGWWRERLAERARRMGLSVREADRQNDAGRPGRAAVVITGLVPPQQVPMMMRAMDVLAHPSSREGLPRTVPQALLAGTAVVAYDADGTREACIDGRTGRLVKVGDVAGLREAVRWMRDNPARRAAMADEGRSMCERAFSAEAMVEALEGVYERALRLARGGAA